jgi:O-antigen/teichoic acid export membrane protein
MSDHALGKAGIRRVAFGSITALAIFVAGAGVSACSQFVIARIVGAETYGIYAYVLAWTTILAYFSALGFDTALLRFIAAYQTMGAWSLARGVIQYAERRVLAVGALVILAGALVIMSRPAQFSPQLRNTFLLGFFLVPVWSLLWVRCSIIRAFGGVTLAVLPDKVVRDGLLLVLVVVAAVVLGLQIDARCIMMATLVGSVVALALASIAMRRLRPSALTIVMPEYAVATWRQAAVPFVVLAAAEALLNRTGVILLGWFGETRQAGIYSLAFNIAFLVVLPRTAINTLFAPAISSLFTRRDQAAIQALVTTAASWTLAAAICIALVLAVFAEPILTWFGKDFAAGVPALRILLAGQVFAASYGSQVYVMTMTEHERGAAALLILSAMVNIAAGVVFIAILGLSGAAVATTIALVIWNVTMARFISRHLQLVPGILGLFGPKHARHSGTCSNS